ncbi:RseA family anti-sigma factor [Colwellia sp. E2M01]|uniref:sigma-E factor negative regulatory protein n=1 Tax=Colwellia sp. E2M01 TaxID=2841561 RepID=UPI001C08EC5E|nr:RseA family anti-sigma factor [Colwellia sp. E2M01]MBU2869617.1 transcriptional regulator [Colwellia sp. E2M01]
MSEIKSESISSLVDNYSPSTDDSISPRLIDSMLKDDELASTWKNYHLIGDVLRDEAPEALQLDLSQSIAEAIAQEATILSPKLSANAVSTKESSSLVENDDSLNAELEISKANNVQDAVQKTNQNTNNVVNATNRFKAKIANFAKPIGQVAIAASAAALMIVGVQHNVSDNSITPNQVVQTVPLAGYANPVSFSVQSPQVEQYLQNQQQSQQSQQAKNEQNVAERVAQQRRLQSLLKDHNQQVKLGAN